MRLPRPYIPLKVRVQVAERQCLQVGWTRDPRDPCKLAHKWLKVMLFVLFGNFPCALDHDPALVNRKRYVRNGKTFYKPAANDPKFLLYREAGPGSDHDIKTRVRGDGAQRSDLGQRRYDKRVAKNRAKRKASLKITAVKTGRLAVGDTLTWPSRSGKIRFIVSTDKSKPKRKWGSRPMQSRGFR